MACFCSNYSQLLAVRWLTATLRKYSTFGGGMDFMIDTCISLTLVKRAAEVPCSASVGHETFELEVFSNST